MKNTLCDFDEFEDQVTADFDEFQDIQSCAMPPKNSADIFKKTKRAGPSYATTAPLCTKFSFSTSNSRSRMMPNVNSFVGSKSKQTQGHKLKSPEKYLQATQGLIQLPKQVSSTATATVKPSPKQDDCMPTSSKSNCQIKVKTQSIKSSVIQMSDAKANRSLKVNTLVLRPEEDIQDEKKVGQAEHFLGDTITSKRQSPQRNKRESGPTQNSTFKPPKERDSIDQQRQSIATNGQPLMNAQKQLLQQESNPLSPCLSSHKTLTCKPQHPQSANQTIFHSNKTTLATPLSTSQQTPSQSMLHSAAAALVIHQSTAPKPTQQQQQHPQQKETKQQIQARQRLQQEFLEIQSQLIDAMRNTNPAQNPQTVRSTDKPFTLNDSSQQHGQQQRTRSTGEFLNGKNSVPEQQFTGLLSKQSPGQGNGYKNRKGVHSLVEPDLLSRSEDSSNSLLLTTKPRSKKQRNHSRSNRSSSKKPIKTQSQPQALFGSNHFARTTRQQKSPELDPQSDASNYYSQVSDDLPLQQKAAKRSSHQHKSNNVQLQLKEDNNYSASSEAEQLQKKKKSAYLARSQNQLRDQQPTHTQQHQHQQQNKGKHSISKLKKQPTVTSTYTPKGSQPQPHHPQHKTTKLALQLQQRKSNTSNQSYNSNSSQPQNQTYPAQNHNLSQSQGMLSSVNNYVVRKSHNPVLVQSQYPGSNYFQPQSFTQQPQPQLMYQPPQNPSHQHQQHQHHQQFIHQNGPSNMHSQQHYVAQNSMDQQQQQQQHLQQYSQPDVLQYSSQHQMSQRMSLPGSASEANYSKLQTPVLKQVAGSTPPVDTSGKADQNSGLCDDFWAKLKISTSRQSSALGDQTPVEFRNVRSSVKPLVEDNCESTFGAIKSKGLADQFKEALDKAGQIQGAADVELQSSDVVEQSGRQKAQEALIIGFDDDPNFKFDQKNPFTKKPILRGHKSETKPPHNSTASFPPPKPTHTPKEPAQLLIINQPVLKASASDFLKPPIHSSHQKESLIEIFDDADKDMPNLQEIFRQKRQTKLQSHSSLSCSKKEQDSSAPPLTTRQELMNMTPISSCTSTSKTIGTGSRQPKSKEELAQLRKAMMKRSHLSEAKSPQQLQLESQGVAQDQSFMPQNKPPPGTQQKLLERLATGKKPEVDRKEMKKLTQKNFQNLPEIKQRVEEERRQKESQARKVQAALYAKQLDERRRTQLKNRQNSSKKKLETATLQSTGALVSGPSQDPMQHDYFQE